MYICIHIHAYIGRIYLEEYSFERPFSILNVYDDGGSTFWMIILVLGPKLGCGPQKYKSFMIS